MSLIILATVMLVPEAPAAEPEVDHGDPAADPTFRRLRIPASPQRVGDPNRGWEYLVTGDYIRSGFPLALYRLLKPGDSANRLGRKGINADLPHDVTAVKARNGLPVVAPNCLSCHAQTLNGEFIVGLGNSTVDMTVNSGAIAEKIDRMLVMTIGPSSAAREAFATFRDVVTTVGPQIRTKVVGTNSADKLAFVLAAYRDPQTLKWQDEPQVPLPPADKVIPTDVPPWWILKKKHAMFYTGVGRGDFARVMMASSLLTIDSAEEAGPIGDHFVDVLAWIHTLEPPTYPKPIDAELAEQGRAVFERRCSSCHGTYGPGDEEYPNLIIGLEEVGTDPALALATADTYRDSVERYNDSWFATGEHAAQLVPRRGYVAPPLDGIWASAPYLHNGSVPTLAQLLDSTTRPRYWRRSFDTSDYDWQRLGWPHDVLNEGGDKHIYDTTLSGHGNQGHTYGDNLSEADRQALLEYLKSL